MGQHLRRRRVGLGHLGPAAAPLRGHLHQRPQLSAQGPPQALRWRWCPRVILLALLPTYQPVPETTSALDPGHWAPTPPWPGLGQTAGGGCSPAWITTP